MTLDINTIIRALAVVGLSCIAALLVWKGDNSAALTVAAMITPGAVQMPKLGGDAAKVVTGLVLVGVLGVGVSACSFFTPKRVESIAKITECVLSKRSLPPADIAVQCGLENTQAVIDIIAGAEKREETARSLGIAEGRQLGAAACQKR